ncbi:MAG: hypothetical protein AAF570_25700, partial [Bacteroidota bacterium]
KYGEGVTGQNLMTIYGAVMQLAVNVEREEKRSSEQSEILDARREIFGSEPYEDGSIPNPSDEDLKFKEIGDNGASGEMPYSHSLLNKDSERKVLLREEALTLAFFCSEFVVRTLIENVTMNLQKGPYIEKATLIDWKKTLRQFLSHPEEAANDWARNVLRYPEIDAKMLGLAPFYRRISGPVEQTVTQEMIEDYKIFWLKAFRKWHLTRLNYDASKVPL